MEYAFLMLLGAAASLGWFYWNRAVRIREAGGAAAFAQMLYRRQFGLARGEHLLHYFSGELYWGPLRPDLGPSPAAHPGRFALGQRYRGAIVAFALTDHDRCALAIDAGGAGGFSDRIEAAEGEQQGMDPFVLFGDPKPRIRRGEEAFAGHIDYPRDGEAPSRVGSDGRRTRCVLIHIEPLRGGPAVTAWIEPLGARALLAWSEFHPALSFARSSTA